MPAYSCSCSGPMIASSLGSTNTHLHYAGPGRQVLETGVKHEAASQVVGWAQSQLRRPPAPTHESTAIREGLGCRRTPRVQC
jgi:hypothetical protein